jgi:hypothetical protein
MEMTIPDFMDDNNNPVSDTDWTGLAEVREEEF